MWSKVKRVLEGGRLDKLGTWRTNFNARLLHSIKLSKEQATRMRLEAIKNTKHDVKINEHIKTINKEIDSLIEMEKDINKGIAFKEFKTKYGKSIIKSSWLFKDWAFKNYAHPKIEARFTTLAEADAEIRKVDTEIKKLQQEANTKLQELDAQVKADPKKIKALQAESQKMIGEYNKKILALEKQMGTKLTSLTRGDLLKLSTTSPSVSKLMKINNGVDNYLATSKVGKIGKIGGKVAIGFSVLSLVYN